MTFDIDCGPCGQSLHLEDVEEPAVIHGLIQTWRAEHQHTELELKMFHDAQIAVDQYRIDHIPEEYDE